VPLPCPGIFICFIHRDKIVFAIQFGDTTINAVYLRKFGIEVPVFHYAIAAKALSFGEGLGEATSAIS